MSEAEPAVSVWPARGRTEAVVLVLHGGAERGTGAVPPWKLAYLRMVPIARALHRAARGHGVEVRLLRNRRYGWNAPAMDPLDDARWALDRIRAEHPGVPVVLVGHSMGGRVALRVADDPAVRGICALAPWTPRGEPVGAVAGRSVLIVHGTRDRMTSPAESHAFAERAEGVAARVARFEIANEGHAMLRRSAVWTRLTIAFTLEVLAGNTGDELRGAWAAPGPERLRIPV
ncbi:alpha-beta hydrolase superfamily lysophospholipase [Amycolatopsis lexingtonensis]|uniref:Alpha-beta hydrolase superfamily lysophospholipase n=1 Tax=Amycolatopsis lexingtonensis TaxID=218822 RepID=A0ABR9I0E8_9PSEU|nr:alpha/beta fold hydrolase [Amycolatopsis lexingtonensis]MBE1496669.1 alpha-beta hydrolase superfamily lysophospholipase [Amycolatopsis lexingtonensis]